MCSSDLYRPLPAHVAACQLAEDYALLRAQVMNAYQACLDTARNVIRLSGYIGLPVAAWNTFKTLSFSYPFYHDELDNERSLIRNYVNKFGTTGKPLRMDTLSLEVIDYSLDMFNDLLVRADKVLIQMVGPHIYPSSAILPDETSASLNYHA